MIKLQLYDSFNAGGDFDSPTWEVLPVFPNKPMTHGSLQVVWSGLDALDATVELQVSNNNTDWNCYGGAVPVTLDVAAESQVFEFREFMSRYVRLRYVRGSVTTGTITIITHGLV